jgi:hypothetical protein
MKGQKMNITSSSPQGQITAEKGLAGRSAVSFVTATTHDVGLEDRVNIYDTTSNAITATLPPVAEAAGMIFTFQLQTDGGNDLTITDDGDDTDFVDVVIKAVNLSAVLISDGIHWFALPHTTGNYGS